MACSATIAPLYQLRPAQMCFCPVSARLRTFARLSSPLVNASFLYKYLPTPANVWYRIAAWRFRRCMMKMIRQHDAESCGAGDDALGGQRSKPIEVVPPTVTGERLEEPSGSSGANGRWSVLQIMSDDKEFAQLSVDDRWVKRASRWHPPSRQSLSLSLSPNVVIRQRCALEGWRPESR